jgi:hypothetical protein
MVTLDTLSKDELKAVSKNVKNLRRLDKELGIKLTKDQKTTRWRCLIEAEIGFTAWKENHRKTKTEA